MAEVTQPFWRKAGTDMYNPKLILIVTTQGCLRFLTCKNWVRGEMTSRVLPISRYREAAG